MSDFIEKAIANSWNRLIARKPSRAQPSGLDLGVLVADGQPTQTHFYISKFRRTQGMIRIGKTGFGKSSHLKRDISQDVQADNSIAQFDSHNELTPHLLRTVAAEELRRGCNLDDRLIVIDPADETYSIGFNPLEGKKGMAGFVQIAEISQILGQRWSELGSRSEEILRNAIYLAASNDLTLVEIPLILTNTAFRAACINRTDNDEVRAYFLNRFETSSEPMKRVVIEPILNRLSLLVGDPHFRSIIGQQRSSFSLIDAIDNGRWISIVLDEARLGAESLTLGSFFIWFLMHSLFARKNFSQLACVYCDEIQRLVSYSSEALERAFSEARKFAVAIESANQHLDQYSRDVRSTLLASGTQICFQLSSADAESMASALAGGKALADLLKHLPPRQAVVKTGSDRWQQILVPDVESPSTDYSDLYDRCRRRWCRPRTEVEREIRLRHAAFAGPTKGTLDGWE